MGGCGCWIYSNNTGELLTCFSRRHWSWVRTVGHHSAEKTLSACNCDTRQIDTYSCVVKRILLKYLIVFWFTVVYWCWSIQNMLMKYQHFKAINYSGWFAFSPSRQKQSFDSRLPQTMQLVIVSLQTNIFSHSIFSHMLNQTTEDTVIDHS